MDPVSKKKENLNVKGAGVAVTAYESAEERAQRWKNVQAIVRKLRG